MEELLKFWNDVDGRREVEFWLLVNVSLARGPRTSHCHVVSL
jgi:hypothetical protein